MKRTVEWLLLVGFVFALWLKRRLTPGWVEVDRTASWTIQGPFAPGQMPADLQSQWDDLKRTGIGPDHPDF